MATAAENSVVTDECLEELLDFFTGSAPYRAKNSTLKQYEIIEKMCLHLFARDYRVQTIDNKDGCLCAHYPASILVLQDQGKQGSARADAGRLWELMQAARKARVFCRFVVPVIHYKGRNICRSATLSTAAEMYGRSGMDWIFSVGRRTDTVPPDEATCTTGESTKSSSEWQLVCQVREAEVKLLQALSVQLICDLMVEMKKTSYGVHVSSSEKADGGPWYSGFMLASLPYPGCEFFVDYKRKGYRAEGLHYQWSKPLNDAHIYVPSPLFESVGVPFQLYQEWNLIEMTKNYLKLFLHFLKHEGGGLLIHCVAGWDRTPLFISLIRLSLWADGLIHQSLSAAEILYLTLAYDWLTFGHKFDERVKKGEEVLYFCFDFLKHIVSDEFSIASSSADHIDALEMEQTSPWQESVPSTKPNPACDASTSTSAHSHGDLMNVGLFRPSVSSVRSSTPLLIDGNSESSRLKRLLKVRAMFCAAYNTAVPDPSAQEDSQQGLISGLFSRLWGGERTTHA